jgi:REP element-mobilizing transposase RayT
MRLPGWDYRRPGPYAITICTEHRWHLFGQVTDGRMVADPAGVLVADAWDQMANAFPTVAFDAWVLMPNHFHAIVRLPGTEVRLGDLVQGFKGLTTSRYADGVHAGRWDPFDGRLWQRNYYDHIVRDPADLDRCRRYIHANPANWASDIDREPDTPMIPGAFRPLHNTMATGG